MVSWVPQHWSTLVWQAATCTGSLSPRPPVQSKLWKSCAYRPPKLRQTLKLGGCLRNAACPKPWRTSVDSIGMTPRIYKLVWKNPSNVIVSTPKTSTAMTALFLQALITQVHMYSGHSTCIQWYTVVRLEMNTCSACYLPLYDMKQVQ